MKIICSEDKGFSMILDQILHRGEDDIYRVEDVVREIIKGVRSKGDNALIEYTRRFDGVDPGDIDDLRVPVNVIKDARHSLSGQDIRILSLAADRIRAFHEMQLPKSWSTEDGEILLGQRVTPLERVGIYCPGGKASYPSTVLMNAIPARVAGVKEIVMVTPPSGRGINPYVLAAADIASVDTIFQIGGAHAVAALAYGTETIPAVDKIVGPGNIYVATAKRLVFGMVDIDMIAGPSEVLIINDGSGKAAWIAADLLSQAEHDEMASAILITTSEDMAEAVSREVSSQLVSLDRQAIARRSIERHSIIVTADNIEKAAAIANRIAPEHLELFVKEPTEILDSIRNAGAIFLGYNTPEAIGDYIAGPNHTLPTGGTARFSSPLGTYDFVKRSSLISFSGESLRNMGKQVIRFTEMEGLDAHAKSVAIRMARDKT